MSKHLDINLILSDIDGFEKDEHQFIHQFIGEYKHIVPHLSEDGVYSLLLICAIMFDRIDIIKSILSVIHKDNILTYTNGLYYSPLSAAVQRGNDYILNIIKLYIERCNGNVERVFLCDEDCANFLVSLRYPRSKFLSGLQFYNDYLIPIYTQESLLRIKELIDTFD